MVAYSFNRRFEHPIVTRAKRHTIRADRRRHARVGEQLQLFTGMRTRGCRKLGTATCTAVYGVRLDLVDGRVETETGTAWTTIAELDAFARSDGFSDWADLQAFWAENHPGVGHFSGVLIGWWDTFAPAEQKAAA